MSARLDTLTSWHADWSGRRVAVLGAGASGFAAADTLAELGARVLVLGEETAEEYERLFPVIGAELRTGPLDEVPDGLRDFEPEVVIASPGFAPRHPLVEWARETRTALWGDVELAWRVRDKVTRPGGAPAEWMLVAGADGARSTAALAAEMLRSGGVRVAPCGGAGAPVLDAVRDPGGFDVLLVELSAGQLHHLVDAAGPGQPVPYAAVCVSAASDDDVAASVYRNTRVACVYNKADAATRRMVEEADVSEGARAIGFDLGAPGPSDLGIVDGIVVDRAFLAERRTHALELTTVAALAAGGRDTPEALRDVLAASALARAGGVSPEDVARAAISPAI